MKYKVAIVDEAHSLKSYSSQRSLALVPILQNIKRIFLLTGTPVLSRPSEVFNILSIIRPDIFKTFWSFGDRYCDP